MGAKIAKVGPPKFSGVRCQEIDVSFPQLYRVTSYEWQMINGELISSDMPAPTAYILEEPAHWRVHARPTITAINAPEADKDFGWIIVRHHHSAELAEGYAAAMWDLEHALLPFNELHCPVYEVRGQFFTLLHRPPIEGRASSCDHVLGEGTPRFGWLGRMGSCGGREWGGPFSRRSVRRVSLAAGWGDKHPAVIPRR